MEVKDFTDEYLKALDERLAVAFEAVGLQAQSHAQDYSPVDTGRLRASITHESSSEEVVIGTAVDYGKYQELGTSRMRAQPFLRPAIVNHLEEYKRLFETFLNG